MAACTSDDDNGAPSTALIRCITPKRALDRNHTQPSRSRERNAVRTRPRAISSSLKPTSTPSARSDSRNEGSNCDQSVSQRLRIAAANMTIGTRLATLWGERSAFEQRGPPPTQRVSRRSPAQWRRPRGPGPHTGLSVEDPARANLSASGWHPASSCSELAGSYANARTSCAHAAELAPELSPVGPGFHALQRVEDRGDDLRGRCRRQVESDRGGLRQHQVVLPGIPRHRPEVGADEHDRLLLP